MADGWLEIDGVPRSNLPEWARPAEDRSFAVILGEVGIACIEGTTGAAAQWEDVLGVASIDDPDFMPQTFILVPRKPPRPPWFAVTPGMLPEEMRAEGTAGLLRAVELGRSRCSGYRTAIAPRERLELDELRRRVLARAPVPGAVEVPVGPPVTAGKQGWRGAVRTLGPLAGVGGYASAMAAFMIMNPVLSAGTVAALAGGGLVAAATGLLAAPIGLLALPRGRRKRERVLVLAPDGCVMGFADGVRALAWDDVLGFAIDEEPPRAVVVRTTPQARGGRVEARWFYVPPEVVQAVAEAYRRRARAED